MRWPWMSKKRHEEEMHRLAGRFALEHLVAMHRAIKDAQQAILNISPGHIGLPGEPLRLVVEVSDALLRHQERRSIMRGLVPFIATRVERALWPEGQG